MYKIQIVYRWNAWQADDEDSFKVQKKKRKKKSAQIYFDIGVRGME